jgi:archaeal type IV pilus assembly protein PilA
MTKISNVRKTTKFKRSIRAISPVIATLLMIAIAVVASLVVYAWVSGYMGFQTNKAGKAIAIPSFTGVANVGTPNVGDLVVYVQNVGQGTVEVSAVYVDDVLIADAALSYDPISPGKVISEGNTVEVTIDGSFDLTLKHNIKVTTTDGTFMTTTGKPGTGGAPSTPAGPLDHFVVKEVDGSDIGDQTVNVAFDIKITAVDSGGAVVTSYTGTNTLSATGISPTSTTGGFTAGVWTGSVTIDTVGTGVSISTSGGGKNGQSNTFDIETAPTAPEFGIDDYKKANTGSEAGRTITFNLVSNENNEVLYLSIITGDSITATITDNGGSATSNWLPRGERSNGGFILRAFYATRTTAGTTEITITLNSDSNAAAVACSISGADITSEATIFDGTSTTTEGDDDGSCSVNRDANANSLIVGALGIDSTDPGNLRAGSQFTIADTQAAVAGRLTSLEYRINTLAQTPLAVGFDWDNNHRNWAMIVDEIKKMGTGTLMSSPASGTGGWDNEGDALANGNNAAYSDQNGEASTFSGYAFTVPSGASITQVRVRLDAYHYYSYEDDDMKIEVSADGGSNWITAYTHTYDLPSSDQNNYYVDVTSWTTWTTTNINNIQTRVTHVVVGSASWIDLDWIPVEVAYST